MTKTAARARVNTRMPRGPARRIVKSQSGLSMVEILLASFILGAVSLSAFGFYKSQHGQYLQQADVTDAQQNLRATMDELTRQIRQAGYRVFGQDAVRCLANNTWLALRYHDGTAVRTQVFFPYYNTSTGRTDLMTQLDGEVMATFAEGIDSVRFTPGGTGGGTEWITVELVARSARQGFQSGYSGEEVDLDKHLYRRLTSTVALRNR
jgi:Tfp pilus assembly protein PilW